MTNHPRQSEMAGYMGGKRGRMGRRSGSRGAGGEAPAGGLGGGAPHWLKNTFLLLRRNENTNKKIQKIHSKKNMQDLIKVHEK